MFLLGLLGEVFVKGGDEGGVAIPGVSVVIPIFGIRRCLPHYVSDVLGRSFEGFRLLLVSSNDSSGSKGVYSECTGGSFHVGIFRGGGKKIDSTHGMNVSGTVKS